MRPATPKSKPSRAVAAGIQRIVDSAGDVSYKAQVRRKGHPSEAKRFASLEDAAKWKRAREAEIDRGVFVDRREAAKHTVGDLLQRYREEVSPTKRGAVVEAVRLKSFERDPIARLNAAAIQGRHVHDWLTRRQAEVQGSTINRELNLLHHVFEKARKAWGVHIENPVALVERPKAAKPRDRRLSSAEIDAICAATGSGQLPTIIRLAVETGMRRGEILAMRWENIDLKGRFVDLELTKNGDSRRVPLNRCAVDLLASLPRPIDGGPVFKGDPHSISTAMRRAVKRARERYEAECAEACRQPDPAFLTNVRLHDGRHEAVSRLVEAGVDQLTTARIVGHRTLAMTNRYYSAGDAHLLAAVDKIAKPR